MRSPRQSVHCEVVMPQPQQMHSHCNLWLVHFEPRCSSLHLPPLQHHYFSSAGRFQYGITIEMEINIAAERHRRSEKLSLQDHEAVVW